MEHSVVLSVSIDDVIHGSVKIPFTSRPAWHATQLECPDLRHTHAHFTQGTRPSKQLTDVGDVKRYLRTVSVASDGVLIVRDTQPFQPLRECIVVLRPIVDGLSIALHIRLYHPSRTQLKRIFALDFDNALD